MTGTKPDEFRRLAQECRATAQTVSTEQARAEMLAMAEVCDRAAAQQTQGTDLSGATAQQNMTAFAKLAPGVNGTKKPGWATVGLKF